jgi:Cohesin loading factor
MQEVSMQQMSHAEQMRGPQAQNQAAYYQHQQYAPASNMAPPSTYRQIPVQNPQQYPQYTSHGQQHVPQYDHPVTPNSHVSYPQQNQNTPKSQKPSQSRRPPETSSNGSMQELRNREQPKTQSKSQPKDQAKSQPVDTPALLIALAEEYFVAAHKIGPSVTRVMSKDLVNEYQKLIATGLGCLESTFKKMRLAPRMEAKVRLRYAGVLFEETENYMEAETALSQGIILCEQVCS